MVYIKLENGEIIGKGNFTFVYHVTKDIELFNKFFEAEKVFKINYIDFSHKMRVAYEYFAIFEECKRRKQLLEYAEKTDEDIEEEIITEITTPASIINYKNIIIGLCKHRVNDFEPMLLKYQYRNKNDRDNRRAIKIFIKYIYDFGSKSSHVNKKIKDQFIPNKENCMKMLVSFHDFLTIYYSAKHKFDSTMIPVRDYIAVPKKVCENMGLYLEAGKKVFVNEKNGRVLYNIFSSDVENISLSQKRDIETVNKLWDENFEDPSNIIRTTENICSSNGDYKYQVYSLPGRPLKINFELLKNLSLKEKIDIIKGICRGIMSMHEYEPPFYHRNICPDAFYIFKVKDKYKALLARFDCTKDTSEYALYTVFNNLEKKILNEKSNMYFAPEVIAANVGINVDWAKADIYALAQTCLFILNGRLVNKSNNYIDVIDDCSINDDIKYIFLEMLSENPNERPNVDRVVETLG
ncbi:protein kinase family protein [Anaerosinus gibii]|uniref:Protein kinase domain-containing protein n=1 Tax=Selenobaculum gibii TaxID=3054208 RepID=A0A9Y2AFF7_9FIRM|nr:serine/threonine protein kinase [Selenobaculum gbiensis]WIW69849.1 hypothetical protein P3F81_07945 [Selenobaculum gbiensis]